MPFRPTPQPVPTSTPGPTGSAAPFEMNILPPEDPVEARVAIPGEMVCFVIEPPSYTQDEVSYSISAELAEVVLEPLEYPSGAVVETCVVPDPTEVEATATVTFTTELSVGGERQVRTDERSIVVWPVADERALDAQPYFDRWVAWLADNQPELGITVDTEWDPTFVSTFLVVSHYAYWNDEWEMVIAWHNMIPPDDWTDVFLRTRGFESAYNIAFRQDSVSGNSEPRSLPTPVDLIR